MQIYQFHAPIIAAGWSLRGPTRPSQSVLAFLNAVYLTAASNEIGEMLPVDVTSM